MTRRDFVASLAAVAAAAPPGGTVLVHEHVLVDFAGADLIRPGRYDAGEVFNAAKPKLDEIARLGCRRLLECTPNFLGRDPRLLSRLSDSTGVDPWTNTGLYGAGNHKYVPAYARAETAEQLAKRWIAEAHNGVEGVKPRFIKTGVNKAPLDELDRKLVLAAAIASRETGLTTASHTGGGAAALEQLEIFDAAKTKLSQFVWVHAHNEKDHAIHRKVAQAGAWVEFDGIGEKSAAWQRECVAFMAREKLLGRTLISQDAGWYHVGEPGGGNFRSYAFLYTGFLPLLDPRWVKPLLVDNPRAAFGA